MVSTEVILFLLNCLFCELLNSLILRLDNYPSDAENNLSSKKNIFKKCIK